MSSDPFDDPLLAEGIDYFRYKFQSNPQICAFGPGRVNLIGEHTDYNDGFVLPFALPYRTYFIGSCALDTAVSTIYSASLNEKASFEINDKLSKGEPIWANYVKGTIFQYLSDIEGNLAFNAVIVSNVPLGSGLSSSAALEVATATFLERLLNCKPSTENGVKKALRCQKAEHTFADTPCGIMDQYISALGSKGNLLLIDCRSNEFQLIPFGFGDANSPVILITNSNVKHTLSGSEYPDRVRQCKEAVSALQVKYPQVKALRDATMDMLDEISGELSDVVYRRAKHAIGEDKRTLAAVQALRAGDYVQAGKLMTESHYSLKDDYEVSCEELDVLVEVAIKIPGVYGSRMTGGGFGGCTVTLVSREAANLLEETLIYEYQRLEGKKCEVYRTEPAEGAGSYLFSELSEEMKEWKEWKGKEAESKKEEEKKEKEGKKEGIIARQAWWDWVVPTFVVALTALVVSIRVFKSRK